MDSFDMLAKKHQKVDFTSYPILGSPVGWWNYHLITLIWHLFGGSATNHVVPSISNIGHAWQNRRRSMTAMHDTCWHQADVKRIRKKRRRSHLVPTKIAICWVPMQYPQSPWGAKQRLKIHGRGPIADKWKPQFADACCGSTSWQIKMFLTYLPQKSNTNHKHKRKTEQPWTTNVFVMVRFCWGQHTNPKCMVKCMLDPWNLNKPESFVTQWQQVVQ